MMKQLTYPYEILIRLNKDGIAGAQYQTITDIVADDDVTILAAQLGSVGPLAVAAEAGVPLAEIMGEAASLALQENEQLKGVIAQMQLVNETLSQQLNEANAKLANAAPVV